MRPHWCHVGCWRRQIACSQRFDRPFRSYSTTGLQCRRRRDVVCYAFYLAFDEIVTNLCFCSCSPAWNLDASAFVSISRSFHHNQASMAWHPSFANHTQFWNVSVALKIQIMAWRCLIQNANGKVSDLATLAFVVQLISWIVVSSTSPLVSRSLEIDPVGKWSKTSLRIVVRYRAFLKFLCCVIGVCFRFDAESTKSITAPRGFVCIRRGPFWS